MLECVDGLNMSSACWNFCLRVPVNSKIGDWLLIWFRYCSRVAAGTCGLPFLHSALSNWFFQKPIVRGYSVWHENFITTLKVYVWHSCAS